MTLNTFEKLIADEGGIPGGAFETLYGVARPCKKITLVNHRFRRAMHSGGSGKWV